MKGIILAGGSGSRLHPVTKYISKQLLPIYDKPMIYYPLSVLMLASIRDILIITTPGDQNSFKKLLGNGSQFGINLTYAVQKKPNGLADAFIVGEKFIGNDRVCLILGDNIFYGQGFTELLQKAMKNSKGATIFGYQVKDPERFGVLEFNNYNKIISIQEKPAKPKSNIAVTGLYFYDNEVVKIAKEVKPSSRGELEISSINQFYLKKDNLNYIILQNKFTWLDTGTHQSLINASNFVKITENRQGLKIACLEEIAFKQGWISDKKIFELSNLLKNNSYGNYLLSLIKKNEKK